MAKDDIKCFLVSLPEILVINSHGALLEKVIITDKFYKRLFCLKGTVVSSFKKMVMSVLQ